MYNMALKNWVNKKCCISRTTEFSYLARKELGIKTICKVAQVESFPDEYRSFKIKKQNFIVETRAA